jgi:hypothetical protein
MKVFRVWGRHVNDCVWLLEDSEADAIEAVSLMQILDEPLTAAPDDKKLGVPRGVILNRDGETFTILGG